MKLNALKYILSGTLALLVIGTAYQFIATKIDDINYPPPGKMIDIGGFSLHINCTGSSELGGPTVVLDAGLGGFSLDWSLVQSEVEKIARVCIFDRAGYGWSDESPHPRTSAYIASELNELLERAGERGPFILVGHSFGGINSRTFANRYPEKIYGVVLVDSPHEDQESVLPETPSQNLVDRVEYSLLKHPRIAAFFTIVGLTRLVQRMKSFEELPVEFREISRAKTSTTKLIRTVSFEIVNLGKSLAELKKTDNALKDKPHTVITAGKPHFDEGMTTEWARWSAAWLFLQKDLRTLSAKSRQVFAEKSGHQIPYEQPEIVISEIKRFFE
jgi:pimeloyl-ACP methyl ester carboxylesterase